MRTTKVLKGGSLVKDQFCESIANRGTGADDSVRDEEDVVDVGCKRSSREERRCQNSPKYLRNNCKYSEKYV